MERLYAYNVVIFGLWVKLGTQCVSPGPTYVLGYLLGRDTCLTSALCAQRLGVSLAKAFLVMPVVVATVDSCQVVPHCLCLEAAHW